MQKIIYNRRRRVGGYRNNEKKRRRERKTECTDRGDRDRQAQEEIETD